MYRHRPEVILPLCGCWYIIRKENYPRKQYLPQVQLDSHTTILATTSRTTLRQTFHNPTTETIKEATYTFPLYDGVSVAGFRCVIGDRTIVGKVKEKNQARTDYKEAVGRGEVAGLLEQDADAADVFTTSIGNVPAGGNVLVEIVYLGELKNDAETDGARFTIPTNIAPRYGEQSIKLAKGAPAGCSGKMNITVDIMLEKGYAIRGIQSPSHPIAVTLGKTSSSADSDADDTFENHLGSSTLALGGTELDKDFVIVIAAKGQDTPRALLETHPKIPNQRALSTTLVPKFNIPNGNPEIVFVVDRSGSMEGKMHLVVEALKVFLKSLPVTVKFNICSFGSTHSFLFDRSKTYDATSLEEAMRYIEPSRFGADFGGTEMMRPIEDVLKKRYKDLPLEVMLLTDGEIWNQDALFKVVNEASQQNARFFTLGIGSGASSSLVEGIARSGRGFAQWVLDGERIDKRIVRMLKAALSPHIKYTLEVKYSSDATEEEGFEIIESFEKSMKMISQDAPVEEKKPRKISLFNTKSVDEPTNPSAGRYDHLPKISVPMVLQTPHVLPELYPHSRTTIYLLLGPETQGRMPQAITLRGKSRHGDLELEIPVQNVGRGSTIHQLAAKKAMQELEEGRGWLKEVVTSKGKTLQSQNEGNWDLIVEREAVRLGTTFQVAGKFCSFVAVQENKKGEDSESETVMEVAPPVYKEFTERRSDKSSLPAPRAFSMTTALGRPAPNAAYRAGQIEAVASAYSPSVSRARKSAPMVPGGGLFGKVLGFGRGGDKSSAPVPPPPPPPPAACRAAPPPAPSAPGGAAPAVSKESEKKKRNASSFKASRKRSESPLFGINSLQQASYGAPGAAAFLSMDDESSSPSLEDSQTTPTTALEKMQALISLQNFVGSWTITKQLLDIISHGCKSQYQGNLTDSESVQKSVADLGYGSWMEKLTADDCATVLAIAWLETVMAEEKDVWEMVVEKARDLLASRVEDSNRVDQLVDGMRDRWEA